MLVRAWIRVPAGDAAKKVLTTALERGFGTFLAGPAEAGPLAQLGRFRLLVLDERGVSEGGRVLGPVVRIASRAQQDAALALAGRAEVVVADATDWKIIPFENLIAAYQGRTQLVAVAKDAAEAKLLFETLEVGVDAVVLSPGSPEDVIALARDLAVTDTPRLDLVAATVRSIRAVGSGDRVCLDTTSLLRVGEGILVGSSSSATFLVHSEALESEYVASRPFRVNAGAVHAYALLPGGRTKYLSELKAGDELLAVGADGATRRVVLGRSKVETRPLLLIEAEANGRRFTTMAQNAETIRFVTPKGPKSVVDLAPGDEVLVRLEDGGRHFGTAVKETIVER